ncbi:hypothetical protein L1049_009339 [Liquidambar formosana]|uniref:Uncharacterized protein n=1 Tax=Liquidambar formosana TaxID=63359 RepID=A0AAP0SB76_LIQFO
MSQALALSCFITVRSSASRQQQRGKAKTQKKQSRSSGGGASVGFGGQKKEPSWRCVQNCGACCKLDKGPAFATPEEIFEDPSDISVERPYFCRVEPDIFQTLYGIDKKRFNKEACNCCRDTIKAIYGSNSKELDNFNCTIRSSSSS